MFYGWRLIALKGIVYKFKSKSKYPSSKWSQGGCEVQIINQLSIDLIIPYEDSLSQQNISDLTFVISGK